jgi:membrane associated rhomboid family serine protease
MLGRILEPVWGPKKFLTYFFVTGIGAALFTLAADLNSHIPTIGASGAIFGLIIAFALIMPNAIVNLYFLFPLKAKYLAVFLAVIEFAATFDMTKSKTANLAHLGGLVTGYVYLKWYPKIRLIISMPINRKMNADKLLEKIKKTGLESLNKKEKQFLSRLSKKER